MSLEKLSKAISSAMVYLEDSMKAVSEMDDLSILVWRAAAELEYALFLFSIIHQGESESSSWKLGLHSKEVEIESILKSARDMLQKAESSMKTGELREAYRKTWMARGYLLRLQEFFEKKRKLEEAAEKSSQ